MQIATGTPVYGRKGQKVGEVGHIVLDGSTKEVTHLVVSKGWLLPRDIVVALDDVEAIASDHVRLRIDEEELERQPDFLEEHYVAPEPGEPLPPGYTMGSTLYRPMAPTLGFGWTLPASYAYAAPPMPVEVEKNVPEGSVTLAEGMDVWIGDEKAGTLAGVRIHPRTEQVSHILVSRGWLFPEERVVPRALVAHVDERGVHLKRDPRRRGSNGA